jgi:hypothetical protein
MGGPDGAGRRDAAVKDAADSSAFHMKILLPAVMLEHRLPASGVGPVWTGQGHGVDPAQVGQGSVVGLVSRLWIPAMGTPCADNGLSWA